MKISEGTTRSLSSGRGSFLSSQLLLPFAAPVAPNCYYFSVGLRVDYFAAVRTTVADET